MFAKDQKYTRAILNRQQTDAEMIQEPMKGETKAGSKTH